MTFGKILATAVASVFFVSACSSNGISVNNSLHARHVAVHITEAAKRGALATEIVGNPLRVSDSAWQDYITRSMRGAHFGPEFDFSTSAQANAETKARLVVQFQPPESSSVYSLCKMDRDIPESLNHKQDRLNAIAAFCVREKAMDWAILEGPMPGSLEDDRLKLFTLTLAQSVIRPYLSAGGDCENANCD